MSKREMNSSEIECLETLIMQSEGIEDSEIQTIITVTLNGERFRLTAEKIED